MKHAEASTKNTTNSCPCASVSTMTLAHAGLDQQVEQSCYKESQEENPVGTTMSALTRACGRLLAIRLAYLAMATMGYGDTTPIEPNGYGFFIGANGIGNTKLRGAANDAVSMAHRYVEELPIIHATNAVLVLQGEAPLLGKKMESQLRTLARRGVRILTNQLAGRVEAEWKELVSNIQKSPLTNSFVLCFASGHGVEYGGSPYLFVPNSKSQPSNPQFPGEYLSFQSITADLSTMPSGWSRLLLVDACRKLLQPKDSTSTRQQPGPEFYAALTNSPGILVLASCEPGQASYEDSELGLGMFTAQYLRLSKETPTPDGIIRLKDILIPLRDNIATKSKASGGSAQLPTIFEAKGGIIGMPVGMSASAPQAKARLRARIENARRILSQAKSSNSIRDVTFKDINEFLKKPQKEKMQWEIIGRIENTLCNIDLPGVGREFDSWWESFLMENNTTVATKDPVGGQAFTNRSPSIAFVTSGSPKVHSLMMLETIQAIEQSLATNTRVSVKVLPWRMETNLVSEIKPNNPLTYTMYRQGKLVNYDRPSYGEYSAKRYVPLLVSETDGISPSHLVHLEIFPASSKNTRDAYSSDPDFVANWYLIRVLPDAKALSWKLSLNVNPSSKTQKSGKGPVSNVEKELSVVHRIAAAVSGTIIDELIEPPPSKRGEISVQIPSPSP